MNRRLVKLAAITYFGFMIATLLVLRDSVATGYELSIYAATPVLVWIFIIGSMIGGTAILSREAFKPTAGNWWLVGLLMAILGIFLATSLHALRGYYLYNPVDPAAHIGMTQDIVTEGHIGENNIYPSLSILLAQISHLANVAPIVIGRYFPSILSVLYPIHIYLLGRVVFKGRRETLLATALSIPPLFGIFHTAVYTQGLAFFSLPLLFYLYFLRWKDNSPGYRVIFVLLLLAMPLAHPHTAIALALFLLTLEIARVAYQRWTLRSEKLSPMTPRPGMSLSALLLTGVAFFSWVSAFAIFDASVERAYLMVSGRFEFPSQIPRAAAAVQMSVIDLAQYVVKSWGPMAFYLLAAGASALFLLRATSRGDRRFATLVMLSAWLVVGELFTAVFFLLVARQVPGRLLVADNALLISPLFVAVGVGYMLQRWQWRAIVKAALATALVGLMSFATVLGLYRSPYVYQPNWQATFADAAGSGWIWNHREPEFLWNGISVLHTDLYPSLGDGIALNDPVLIEEAMRIGYYGLFDVPSHFGYYGFWQGTTFDTIGQMYAEKHAELIDPVRMQYRERGYVRYWVITERGRTVGFDPALRERRIAAHSEMGRWDFEQEDFDRLERDYTVARVYSSGAYEVWFIP